MKNRWKSGSVKSSGTPDNITTLKSGYNDLITEPITNDNPSVSVTSSSSVSSSEPDKNKDKNLFGEHVLLTGEEAEKLKGFFGQDDFDSRIEEMNLYIEKIGKAAFNKKYKSHYATLLSWYRMECEKKGIKPKKILEKKMDPKKGTEIIEGARTQREDIQAKYAVGIEWWNQVINHGVDGREPLRSEINKHAFDTFIAPLIPIGKENGGKTIILFAEPDIAGWIDENYKERIQDAIGKVVRIVNAKPGEKT